MFSNELLGRANAFAPQRYGLILSERRLRRWVALGLVPGPEPHGQRRGVPPEWQWPPLSYRRVLQVCRMRKRGFKRASAIMFHLWLGGAAYPFSRVRRATMKEYRRLRKAVVRPVPVGWDPRLGEKALAPGTRAAVLRGLGSGQIMEPILPPEVVLQVAGAMLFGVGIPVDTMLGLLCAFGVPETLIEEGKRSDLTAADLDLGLRTLAGLAADPEDSEISAEAALEEADEEIFTNIRDFARVAPWMYGMVPAIVSMMYSQTDNAAALRDALAKATRMLHDPSYRLLHFVFMVRRAQLKGDHGRGIGIFTRLVLRPLRRLMVFIASDTETQALLQEAITCLGIEKQTSLAATLPMTSVRRADPALRTIAWKLIRTTWRHGLSDLWKLRKPPRRTN